MVQKRKKLLDFGKYFSGVTNKKLGVFKMCKMSKFTSKPVINKMISSH